MIAAQELRRIAQDGAAGVEVDYLKALLDAADEIERLSAQLVLHRGAIAAIYTAAKSCRESQ